MKKKYIKISLLLIVLVISAFLVPMTFSKYFVSYTRSVTLNISKPTYDIVFHSNTSPDQTVSQTFTYGNPQNLRLNTFTNGSKIFVSWNTNSNGTGTTYQNGAEILNLSSVNEDVIDLYAVWSSGVASIDGVEYPTIHDAVSAVLADDVERTIVLLSDIELDTDERVSVVAHKNIVLDLNGKQISNKSGANLPLIENYGRLTITNGTLHTDAAQAAVNNESNGHLIVDGVTMTSTGSKQALYNNGGYVLITGDSHFSNTSNNRAAVQNKANSTMVIESATITANTYYGVLNEGTLTVGVQDGTSDRTNPVIQGTYGIHSTTNFDYYDGTFKGTSGAIEDETKVDDVEIGYELSASSEIISGKTYHTVHLSNQVITVSFEANGGTVSESSRKIEQGTTLGTLPVPEYTGFIFEGWYDAPTGGNHIKTDTVINNTMTLYAHWVTGVAEVNGTYYTTLSAALASIKTSAQTTITMYGDASINYTIASNRNLAFDLNDHTLSNNNATPVLTNNGTLKIINGTVTSNATQGAINNNASGNLEISNTHVVATGTRQAVYNNGGTLLIDNDSVLSAVSVERPALTNINNGHVTVVSATITSSSFYGIDNSATLTIGVKDGVIDQTDPVIVGDTIGINNTGTLNFYDGIIKGKSSAVSGSIAEIENNAIEVNSTEVIDNNTYYTKTQSL